MTGGAPLPLAIAALAAATVVSACHDSPFDVPSEPIDAPFVTVSAGVLHTCGVTTVGTAYCWGWNRDGEVGDGSHTDRTFPVRVSGGLHFTVVSAGGGHSCGVTTTQLAYCWGFNLSGQLGDGGNAAQPAPVAVAGGLDFSTVRSGGAFSCGVVRTDSTAACWGWNGRGQLGDGTQVDRNAPVLAGTGLKVIAVSTGVEHTCALATDSTAYCWGKNGYGQLGDGSTADTSLPAAVSGGRKFAAITVGFQHTCGLTAGGDAYCWGDNTAGQMGDTLRSTSPVPVLVVGGHIFLALSAGGFHTCGVATGNTAYCWGSNDGGQLGGSAPESCLPAGAASLIPCSRRPIPLFGTLNFATISGGSHHTCAVTTGQVAYCWGYNSNGQLGDGTKSGSNTPVRVAAQP